MVYAVPLHACRPTDSFITPCAPPSSEIAEHMIIVTGRSVPHMRKMADTVVAAVCIVVRVGLLVLEAACLNNVLAVDASLALCAGAVA